MELDCLIYDDLPNNEEKLTNKVSQLQDEIKTLEEHIQSLEADIGKLATKLIEMKKIRDNLSKNLSELYKTAKAEIDRKDRIISDLRNQLNQYRLQKKLDFSSVKRSREKSTDSCECDAKRVKKIHNDNQVRSLSLSKESTHKEKVKDQPGREHRVKSCEQEEGKHTHECSTKLKLHRVHKSKTSINKDNASKTTSKEVINKMVERNRSKKECKEGNKVCKKHRIQNMVSHTIRGNEAPGNVKQEGNDKDSINKAEKEVKGACVVKDNAQRTIAHKAGEGSELCRKMATENVKEPENNKQKQVNNTGGVEKKVKPEQDKIDAHVSINAFNPNLNVTTVKMEMNNQRDVKKASQIDQSIRRVPKKENNNTKDNKYKSLPIVSLNRLENKNSGCTKMKLVNEGKNISDTEISKAKSEIAKIESRKIENVTKKLHMKLEESKTSECKKADSNVLPEQAQKNKETLPDKDLLNSVKNTAVGIEEETVNSEKSIKLNVNISNKENICNKTENKEVKVVCETKTNTITINKKSEAENNIDRLKNPEQTVSNNEINNPNLLNGNKEREIAQNIKPVRTLMAIKSKNERTETSKEKISSHSDLQMNTNRNITQVFQADVEINMSSTVTENFNIPSEKKISEIENVKFSQKSEEKEKVKNDSKIVVNTKSKMESIEENASDKISQENLERKTCETEDICEIPLQSGDSEKKEDRKTAIELNSLQSTTPIDVGNEESNENDIEGAENCSNLESIDAEKDKNEMKKKDSKSKKITAPKKELKDKIYVNNKKEEEVQESDRVLRSATRRNSCKEKLEKSAEPTILIGNGSEIGLSHVREIPVLHICDPDHSPENGTDNLFSMNLSFHNCPPQVTSSPLNRSVDMRMLSEDLNISLDQSDIQINNKIETLNASSKSENVTIVSNGSRSLNTSSARKRRRVVCTLID